MAEVCTPILLKDKPLEPPAVAPCSTEDATKRLRESAYSAEVMIKTDKGTGSGFFADKEGHVVTASHVVLDARELFVVTQDGERYRARIEKLDDTGDMVSLKLENFGNRKQPFLNLIETPALEVNTKAFAIGNPRGIEEAYVSPGTISAKYSLYDLVDKDKVAQKYKNAGEAEKADWLKALSAQVYEAEIHVEPGNSGGLLALENGNGIGMTAMRDSVRPQSISYYRQSEDVKRFLNDPVSKFKFEYTYEASKPEDTFAAQFQSWRAVQKSSVPNFYDKPGQTKDSGGPQSGEKKTYYSTTDSANIGELAQFSRYKLADDYQLYKTSNNTRDSIKYGLASMFDKMIDVGERSRWILFYGSATVAIGMAGRVLVDKIPNHLVLTEVKRTDGTNRPPFDWKNVNFKSRFAP